MRPVIVLGAHRSGTSALTRVINLLGPSGVPEEDLMPANPGNPEGFWESVTLTDFDDRLLSALGAFWDAPPPPGRESGAVLEEYSDTARQLVGRLLPGSSWVWKDPRISLLLSFWRPILEEAVFVLAHRSSLPAAQSLARRDDSSLELAMALWQRYCTASLRELVGARVLVVDWEAVQADPEPAVAALSRDLASLGVEASFNEAAWQTIHRPTSSAESLEVPEESKALRELMIGLGGPHEAFPAQGELRESDWVEPLLAAHRRQRILNPPEPRYVVEMRAEISRLRGYLSQVESAAKERASHIAELEEYVANLERVVGEREADISALSARLAEGQAAQGAGALDQGGPRH